MTLTTNRERRILGLRVDPSGSDLYCCLVETHKGTLDYCGDLAHSRGVCRRHYAILRKAAERDGSQVWRIAELEGARPRPTEAGEADAVEAEVVAAIGVLRRVLEVATEARSWAHVEAAGAALRALEATRER